MTNDKLRAEIEEILEDFGFAFEEVRQRKDKGYTISELDATINEAETKLLALVEKSNREAYAKGRQQKALELGRINSQEDSDE